MAQDPNANKDAAVEVPSVKFHTGITMPQLGFGTYKLEGDSGRKAIEHALTTGYRHLDSAIFYDNEEELGKAIKNSKIPRRNLFITSKLWGNQHGKHGTTSAVKSSLRKIGSSYIDLYLIHSPIGGKNIETYKTLLDFQKQGKIKSVGVSNYGVEHLKAIEDAKLPLPVVNQIELHPWLQQREIVEYCNKKGIIIEAYSPLAKGQKLKKRGGKTADDVKHNQHIDQLFVMASNYSKTPAQILVRWSLQTGHVCLVKSSNNDRIEANFDTLNWKLSDEDMKKLNAFEEDYHCTWDPTTTDMSEF